MTQQNLHIALLISTLKSGGAERSVVNLASALASRGYRVSILTYSTPDSDFYTVPAACQRLSLDLMGVSSNPVMAVYNNLKRIAVVRKAINQHRFDVLISFMDSTNVTAVLAGLGCPCSVMISERIHPEQHGTATAWALLRKLVYRYAACVVVQTAQVKDWITQHGVAEKVAVIPNFFVQPAQQTALAKSYLERPKVLLAAGRLCEQKGFDILIEAFVIAAKHPKMHSWTLKIYGDGELRGGLQSQLVAAKLTDSVELVGKTDKLYEQMQQCRNFILSSRNEGFPNVLLEAMSAGCAVAAFSEVSGVQELIEHNVSGLGISPQTPEALAEGIIELCVNEERSASYAMASLQRASQYSEATVVPLWESCFER